MTRKVLGWFLTGSLFLLLADLSEGEITGACKYQKWARPGDVKLLVIAGVHSNNNGVCGDISTDIFPLLVSLDWILDIINGGKSNATPFLPNITIGYEVYDNCDDEDITVDLMYPGFSEASRECSGQSANFSGQIYAGVFSLTTPEATRAVSRLAGSLPVFRALAPAPGLYSQLQPNLIQTVCSFDDEAEILVQFLVEMKWNFVFLVYTNDEYGTTTREVFTSKAREKEICIHLEQTLMTQYVKLSETTASALSIIDEFNRQVMKGYDKSMAVVYLGNARGARHLLEAQKGADKLAGSKISWVFSQGVGMDFNLTHMTDFSQNYGLTVSHTPIIHRDFKEYLRDVLLNTSNTMYTGLKSDYLSAIGCSNTPGGTCHKLDNDAFNFLSNFIDSVLLSVALLGNLHANRCQSDGLCPIMREMLSDKKWYSVLSQFIFKGNFLDQYLPEAYQSQDRSLQFTRSGHVSLSSEFPLEIYRLPGTSDKTGVFDGNKLSITGDVSSFPTSACKLPGDCPVCRQHLDLRYSYLHGDILLLGLFSIHKYGDTPFVCGTVRHDTNDAITVSAFMESIVSLRKKTGINYGGIAIDDCYNSFNTSALLSDLFSKKTVLRDHNTGRDIDFDNVFVIVGALSSPVSLVIGDLSTTLGIPMISYGASSPELDNKERYPLFLRTVPSDTRQVKGIIQLMQNLNVTFVGALYIDDAYGRNGIKGLLEEAERSGICIYQPTAITQDMDDKFLEKVLTDIYLNGTRVIIYFSIDSLALRILDILASSATLRDKMPLVFIASEAWGTNQNFLQGSVGQKAQGSIVFNVETVSQDNIEYKNFLLGLNSSYSLHNRWVPKFFEDVYKCDFITSFDKSRPGAAPCGSLLKLDEGTATSLYQDQRGVHVMHTVKASVEGFSNVVNKICGGVSVCPYIRKNGRSLKNAIQGAGLDSAYGRLFPFDASGSGNIGYAILNIQKDSRTGKLSYVKIGSFSKEDKLILSSSPIFYNDRQQPTTLSEMFPYNIHCSYNAKACSAVCYTSTQPTPPSTNVSTDAWKADTDDDSITLITTVVLAVVVAILAVAFIFVVVVLLRRQSHHISDETFTKTEVSTSATSNKFPISNNIYNEVNDYQGQYPRSHISTTGSVSMVCDGPVIYADLKQAQMCGNMFRYPEARPEVLSPISTQSLSPGMSRPTKPPVKHTRSLSDSRIADTYVAAMKSPHAPTALPGHLSPSTRSKGLENLNEINYSSSDMLNYRNKQSVINSSNRDYDDSETESYVDSGQGFQPETDFKTDSNALNYITAKDLMNHSDEEDSVGDGSEESIKNMDPNFGEHNATFVVNGRHEPYDKNFISPSDQEVMAINFPRKDRVTYSSNNHLHQMNELPRRDRYMGIAKDSKEVKSESYRTRTDRNMSGNQRNNSKASMSSVPDIIPYDADELPAATSDSDEQEVFII